MGNSLHFSMPTLRPQQLPTARITDNEYAALAIDESHSLDWLELPSPAKYAHVPIAAASNQPVKITTASTVIITSSFESKLIVGGRTRVLAHPNNRGLKLQHF